MSEILRFPENFDGCDFVVQLGAERLGTEIRLLQITDMQFIDSLQRRTPDRLRTDEINAWRPSLFDANGGDQIRSLAAQVRPDLIFITGDIVYGSFDDSGTTLRWFCDFMDSLCIPWAPVWGNHDNESHMGVMWQCAQLEASKYCVFARGSVSGNSNYTVGIACGDTLQRVLYMVDSNGCHSDDPSVIGEAGIRPDQLERIQKSAQRIAASQGRTVPAFMAFHIPTEQFRDAESAKGYLTDERQCYAIGVDTEARDDDFVCKFQAYRPAKTPPEFADTTKGCGVDGIFVGHCHSINTCIRHDGVRFVFGLKTAQYDFHNPYQLGGTRITLKGDEFDVVHVPALTRLAPMPSGCRIFDGFFAEDEEISE